jgi:hypothetical protein
LIQAVRNYSNGPATMEPYTQPIRKFARDQNISPTRVYQWIDKGEIESVVIGNRRHVIVPSYRKMVDRMRAEQGPVKLPSSNPKARQAPAAPSPAIAQPSAQQRQATQARQRRSTGRGRRS